MEGVRREPRTERARSYLTLTLRTLWLHSMVTSTVCVDNTLECASLFATGRPPTITDSRSRPGSQVVRHLDCGNLLAAAERRAAGRTYRR